MRSVLAAWLSIANSAQAQENQLIKFTRCHGSTQVTQNEVQDPLFDGSVPFEVWPWMTDDRCQGPALSVLTQAGSYVEALSALKSRYDESVEAEVYLSTLLERVNACDPSTLDDAHLWVCPTQVDGSYFVDEKDECSRGERHPATYILTIGDYAEKYSYRRPKTHTACAGVTPAEVTNAIRRYGPKTSLFYLYTTKVSLNIGYGLKKAMDTASWDCLGGLCLNATANNSVNKPKSVPYNGQSWNRTAKICGNTIVNITYFRIFFNSDFESTDFKMTKHQVIQDHIKLGWAPPLDQPRYPLLIRYDKKGMREIKEHSIEYDGKTYPALSFATHHPQTGEICQKAREKELE